jgi:hypothetical protein
LKIRIYFSALSLVLITGCASTPPVEPEYGYQSNGQYKLFPHEQAKNCAALTKDIRGEIPAIAALERKALGGRVLSSAFFVVGFASTGTGPITDYGKQAAEEAKKLRARADAYNNALASKNCTKLDIDSEVAKEKERQYAAEPAPEAQTR